MRRKIIALARTLQGLDRWVPARWRLPLRFLAQKGLGALEPEMHLLPRLLEGKPGIAVDVGANVGIYTYALARMGRDVHAFEPQPACLGTLSGWARGRGGIKVHPVAVGERSQVLMLHVPVASGRSIHTRASFQKIEGAREGARTPVVALDSLDLPRTAFIKVDVEGFELQVLRGARALLARDRPALMVEIDPARHGDGGADGVIRWMVQQGYTSHALVGGSLVAASRTPAPGGSCNLIFLPEPAP